MIINVLAQSGGPGLEGFILPIAMVGIFYFLGIRPQQKKQKADKVHGKWDSAPALMKISSIHG